MYYVLQAARSRRPTYTTLLFPSTTLDTLIGVLESVIICQTYITFGFSRYVRRISSLPLVTPIPLCYVIFRACSLMKCTLGTTTSSSCWIASNLVPFLVYLSRPFACATAY